MISLSITLAFVDLFVLASSLSAQQCEVWDVSKFDSLITFGDSYTDENRLNYFGLHNGSAPPPGTFLPESFDTASGSIIWPRYVVQYTGSTVNNQWTPQMTLYDYAVAGAVCSNEISPRWLASINANFPAVLDYEVLAFTADKTADRNGTSQPYFEPALSASNAVYALWIGTNDLGIDAFLTDSQVRGKTLTDYVECNYQVLDGLYAQGARVFVLFNTAPLQLTPLYANSTLHGAPDNQYWNNKTAYNATEYAEIMHEATTSVNTIFKYQTPYEFKISGRYPNASIALFDVWSLISDIYDNPTQYLNGSQPANVTGYEHHCSLDRSTCTLSYNGTSPDSFLWFDELHPSTRTDQIIAENFVQVLNGSSKYATYY